MSVTFDDFPQSAVDIGAKVIEDCGAKATFYGCFGMPGAQSASGPIADLEAAHLLSTQGHEIGCHTFSHKDCSLISSAEMARECAVNRRTASDFLGVCLTSFAYPFGGISPQAKTTAGRYYETARSVWPGINRGTIDLMALRSYGLPTCDDSSGIDVLLDDLGSRGGWLIFYSHDVGETPSPFGCTPSCLAYTLEKCNLMGIPVLPISSAVHMAQKTR